MSIVAIFFIIWEANRESFLLGASRMSDFEPSPRSSKRRKVGTFGAGSPKVKTPPSTYNSITHAVSSISRRLFKSRDNEEDLVVGGRLTSIEDSAYGSKEDSVNEEDVTVTTAASAQLADGRVRGSESADELAQSEVTVTPTKSQRNRQRRKETTGKATENAADPEDEKFDDTPVHSRTSGRERRRPRRYSTGLEDTSTRSLPKGILTPSRKGNRGPRKSVAFDQDEIGVESDMGFKDLDKTSKKKTQRLRQRKSPDREDEAEQQDEGTIYHNTSNNKEKSAAAIEDELIPEIPELPDIVLATSKDASPSTIDSRLDSPKCVVLARLTSQSFTPLTNLEDEYSKLHSLLSATITAGEGNSILLLGSRGVGKSCLVETAIADLAIEYSQDFHVVRLNGFIQTDDKLALREIWRQLGREMRVEEDETAQVSSYADTMASLLHLLSHPEELAEVLEPDAPTRTTKSVVFVLDEFDLFTTHSRQTLLYNLFDIAQARKAPIAVIGCTARVDVTDSLEKRVKSRFSHRWIHISLPKSFPAFENIARAALLLEETDKYPKDQRLLKDIRRDWNNFIEVRDITLRPNLIFKLTRALTRKYSSLQLRSRVF